MPQEQTVANPLGAFGQTAQGGQTVINVVNNTATAIAKGDAVIIATGTATGNTNGCFVTVTTTADSVLAVGIATTALAASGGEGIVCIYGAVLAANVATASTTGDLLATSTVAGRLHTAPATTGAGGIVGVCLSPGSSNTANVWVKPA